MSPTSCFDKCPEENLITELQVESEEKMESRYLCNRAILIFLGSVLLLVPLAIGLIYLYEDAQSSHVSRDLPPIPSLEVLSDIVQKFNPELTDPQLEVAYEATLHPRSGLLVLYKVNSQDRLVYRLAVVRHDIACSTCRDLLVGIFFDSDDDCIIGIEPLEPWELAEGVVDPTVFLTQFKGRSLLDSLRIGQELDGITGASLTVQALLTELGGLNQRITKSLH